MQNVQRIQNAESEMQSTECKVYRVCSVQIMKSKNVNQEGRKYLPSSLIAANYVFPSVGGCTHIAIEGSQAGATPVILADL